MNLLFCHSGFILFDSFIFKNQFSTFLCFIIFLENTLNQEFLFFQQFSFIFLDSQFLRLFHFAMLQIELEIFYF